MLRLLARNEVHLVCTLDPAVTLTEAERRQLGGDDALQPDWKPPTAWLPRQPDELGEATHVLVKPLDYWGMLDASTQAAGRNDLLIRETLRICVLAINGDREAIGPFLARPRPDLLLPLFEAVSEQNWGN